MSHHSHSDISHRLHSLVSSNITSSNENILQALKSLMQSCRGQEMESKRVLTSMVKLTHVKDTRVKRLVYMYLSLVSDDESEMWLQITNSIANDLANPSPAVRQSALLVLTDSHSFSDAVNEIRVSSVMKCLKDSNSNIRKTAIAGCSKLFALFSNKGVAVDFSQIFEMLSKMIYTDENASVIIECIRCLKFCGQNVMKMDLFLSLLERLDMVENWTKAEVVHLFNSFADPSKMTHETIFQVLNMLDPFLDHKFPIYLSISCIAAMLNVSKQFSKIHSDVSERIVNFLLNSIAFCTQDHLSLVLPALNVIASKTSLPKLILHFKSFLLLSSDTSFIKLQKVLLLAKVCDKSNAAIIFTQFTSCALTSEEEDLIRLAIDSLFHVHPFMPEQCENFLRYLLKHSSSLYIDTALITLMHITCCDAGSDSTFTVNVIEDCFDVYSKLFSYEAKSVYFWFFFMNPKKEYMKTMIQNLAEEESNWDGIDNASFQLYLLQIAMRFFFLAPKSCKPLLGKLLHRGAGSRNLLINRQAFYYYKLLRLRVDAAKTFFTQMTPQSFPKYSSFSSCIDIEKLKGLTLLCHQCDGDT